MMALRSSDRRLMMCSSSVGCFPVRVSVLGHVELLVHGCFVMITSITIATVSTWVTNGGTTGNCWMRMDTSWLAAYSTMVMVMMLVVVMTHLSTGTRTGHAVPTVRTVSTSQTVIAVTL